MAERKKNTLSWKQLILISRPNPIIEFSLLNLGKLHDFVSTLTFGIWLIKAQSARAAGLFFDQTDPRETRQPARNHLVSG